MGGTPTNSFQLAHVSRISGTPFSKKTTIGLHERTPGWFSRCGAGQVSAGHLCFLEWGNPTPLFGVWGTRFFEALSAFFSGARWALEPKVNLGDASLNKEHPRKPK